MAVIFESTPIYVIRISGATNCASGDSRKRSFDYFREGEAVSQGTAFFVCLNLKFLLVFNYFVYFCSRNLKTNDYGI
jgi:hypothetical protein